MSVAGGRQEPDGDALWPLVTNGVHPLNKIWRPGIKNAKREPGLSRAFLNMGNLNINGAKWGKNW